MFPKADYYPSSRRREQGERAPTEARGGGTGPVSLLAWGVEQDLFELTAVDPLARDYAQVVRQSGCSYPVIPIGRGRRKPFCHVRLECLRPRIFQQCARPRGLANPGLQELTRVVDKGGIIYSEGFIQWRGLESPLAWTAPALTFCSEHGQLVHYGRDGSRTSLMEEFEREPIYETARDSMIAQSSHMAMSGTRAWADWHLDDWYTFVMRVTAD